MSRSVQQQQQPKQPALLAEAQKTTASFDVSKQFLHDSLITVLNTCNLRVYGYNAHYDAFWGKKTQENGGHYSFELSLKSITDTNTQVAIETLTGNQHEAIEILASIKESLRKTHTSIPVARILSARV